MNAALPAKDLAADRPPPQRRSGRADPLRDPPEPASGWRTAV